jgi:hypothetical protein
MCVAQGDGETLPIGPAMTPGVTEDLVVAAGLEQSLPEGLVDRGGGGVLVRHPAAAGPRVGQAYEHVRHVFLRQAPMLPRVPDDLPDRPEYGLRVGPLRVPHGGDDTGKCRFDELAGSAVELVIAISQAV